MRGEIPFGPRATLVVIADGQGWKVLIKGTPDPFDANEGYPYRDYHQLEGSLKMTLYRTVSSTVVDERWEAALEALRAFYWRAIMNGLAWEVAYIYYSRRSVAKALEASRAIATAHGGRVEGESREGVPYAIFYGNGRISGEIVRQLDEVSVGGTRVDLAVPDRAWVTFVLTYVDPRRRTTLTPLRYTEELAGLTVANAISMLRTAWRIAPFHGPFRVRERGEGETENEWQEVPEDSDRILTGRDILCAAGLIFRR